jgi:hypothetical protein
MRAGIRYSKSNIHFMHVCVIILLFPNSAPFNHAIVTSKNRTWRRLPSCYDWYCRWRRLFAEMSISVWVTLIREIHTCTLSLKYTLKCYCPPGDKDRILPIWGRVDQK